MAPKAPTSPRKGVAVVQPPPKRKDSPSKPLRTHFSGLPKDYMKWKNDDLKDLCRSRELEVGGNKQALVDRLNAYNSLGDSDEDEVESPPKKLANPPKKAAAAPKKGAAVPKAPSRPKGSGSKNAPTNGFKAGEDRKATPTKPPTPEPPMKAKRSEIARAKRYRGKLLDIITQIMEGNGDDDKVFADVVRDLDRAKKEFLQISRAERSDDEPTEHAAEQDEDVLGSDNEGEEKEGSGSPSSSAKRARDDEDEEYREDDEDSMRKRSKLSESSEEEQVFL